MAERAIMAPAFMLLLDHLHRGRRLRVWSIVVSVFGDSIAPRGGRAAMSDLQTIASALGIEGGALRTAMSRLAKEGWVEREREGRNSFYRLSQMRDSDLAEASRRIYAPSFVAPPGPWHVAVDGPASARTVSDALPIARNVRLLSAEDTEQARADGCLVLEATAESAPDWIADVAFGTDLIDEYRALSKLFVPLAEATAALVKEDPLNTLVARTLAIHHWRRLILRHPPPPANMIPSDWPGAVCHEALKAFYPVLVERSEAWWSERTSGRGRQILASRFAQGSHAR